MNQALGVDVNKLGQNYLFCNSKLKDEKQVNKNAKQTLYKLNDLRVNFILSFRLKN